jgi:hypothetical protein
LCGPRQPATSWASAVISAAINRIQLLSIALLVLTLAGTWRVFQKAGVPGWGSIVPLYNCYLWTKVAGKRPGFTLLLWFFVTGIVAWPIVMYHTARKSRRSRLFFLDLIFLPYIFLPVLGFGPAEFG